MDGFRSLIVPVPEVEALVDPLRRSGDPWRDRGVPAHLTLAGPWPLEVELPRDELAGPARELRGTRFELGTIGPLGGALCLFPTDDAALLAGRERILRAVGVPDLLDDAWRLHLTVRRHGAMPIEAGEDVRSLERALPIACAVGGLTIAELDEGGRVSLRALG